VPKLAEHYYLFSGEVWRMVPLFRRTNALIKYPFFVLDCDGQPVLFGVQECRMNGPFLSTRLYHPILPF